MILRVSSKDYPKYPSISQLKNPIQITEIIYRYIDIYIFVFNFKKFNNGIHDRRGESRSTFKSTSKMDT